MTAHSPAPSDPRAPDDPTVQLLERWRGGDRAALDQLLGEVLPWLHQEVSRALGSQPRGLHDSMDLVQTAVVHFLTWGPRFVPNSAAQLRALLRRIATNELIDQRRRIARGLERHVESFAGSGNPLSGFGAQGASSRWPSRAVEAAEELGWVRLALQFLPEADRFLLLAREVEGLGWAAIAAELGLEAPEAARMRCARLKPRLANLIRKLQAGQLPDTVS